MGRFHSGEDHWSGHRFSHVSRERSVRDTGIGGFGSQWQDLRGSLWKGSRPGRGTSPQSGSGWLHLLPFGCQLPGLKKSRPRRVSGTHSCITGPEAWRLTLGLLNFPEPPSLSTCWWATKADGTPPHVAAKQEAGAFAKLSCISLGLGGSRLSSTMSLLPGSSCLLLIPSDLSPGFPRFVSFPLWWPFWLLLLVPQSRNLPLTCLPHHSNGELAGCSLGCLWNCSFPTASAQPSFPFSLVSCWTSCPPTSDAPLREG